MTSLFLKNPRLASLRVLAGMFTLFAVVGCSGPDLPTAILAKPRLLGGRENPLRDHKLAANLLLAESMPVSEASAITESVILGLQARVHLHDWKEPLRIEGRSGSWEISFDQNSMDLQGGREWCPSWFDRVVPVSGWKLEGYDQTVAGDGAGTPLILAFEDIAALRRERTFRPGNGLYVPGTAVLEFGKRKAPSDPMPVRIRIFNTLDERTATVQGHKLPLAWNMTAAIEYNLDNPYMLTNGLAGLLRPDRREKDLGLFAMRAYDPKKIPVVFVHGLNSDPHIWKNVVNEIEGDPVLKSRYLPLLFLYPTGMPVPAAAAKLRESLTTYRNRWDPENDDPGFNQMVIVGHSMGGLLTRLQVIDSGDHLTKAFFARPISEIPWLARHEKKSVEASLKFQPLPFVKRVVFVAVPHQGSRFADKGIVRLAVRMIRLPGNTVKYVGDALTSDPSLLNPALLQYHSLGLRSVDMLSPGHPYFSAIQRCSITVPCHSIIGDRGKNNGADGTDGVVPYWSSHVKCAVSEKIVPHGHSCTAERETVDELLRILRLHPSE